MPEEPKRKAPPIHTLSDRQKLLLLTAWSQWLNENGQHIPATHFMGYAVNELNDATKAYADRAEIEMAEFYDYDIR